MDKTMHLLSPPDRFETSALLARPLRESDSQSVFDNLLSDGRVTLHLPGLTHSKVEETQWLIHYWEAAWRCSLSHVWGLEDKKTKEIVGLIEIRPTLPRAEVGIATIRR